MSATFLSNVYKRFFLFSPLFTFFNVFFIFISTFITSMTRTSQAKHAVDHSHEISTLFQHGLECIMPRYTGIIHSRPWRNVHLCL